MPYPKETLPLSFNAIPEDFTGWYVQMKQIKQVSETKAVGSLDAEEIKKVREEVKKQLLID